jgi:hypothetical protein
MLLLPQLLLSFRVVVKAVSGVPAGLRSSTVLPGTINRSGGSGGRKPNPKLGRGLLFTQSVEERKAQRQRLYRGALRVTATVELSLRIHKYDGVLFVDIRAPRTVPSLGEGPNAQTEPVSY